MCGHEERERLDGQKSPGYISKDCTDQHICTETPRVVVDFPTGLARGSRSSHFTVSDVSSSLLGSPALGSVGSFFLPLPNNVEELPHTYLFVAMEPSGNWLRTEAEGRRKVSEGYVNFATTLSDHALVFTIRKYLQREGEGFYITDMGKCSTSNGKKCNSSPRLEVV